MGRRSKISASGFDYVSEPNRGTSNAGKGLVIDALAIR